MGDGDRLHHQGGQIRRGLPEIGLMYEQADTVTITGQLFQWARPNARIVTEVVQIQGLPDGLDQQIQLIPPQLVEIGLPQQIGGHNPRPRAHAATSSGDAGRCPHSTFDSSDLETWARIANPC
ncbi:hypothetical protein SMD11_3880 [Streptomyces albireticuli]|uniref:Uncharacterized protein n=1 Tax=Streptomyces albireticuli TaxID=1940 RepID=A0A1Z2L5C4_9ACTN|nr:hypothetical protein SMD11_3880 [Streptomyces albireticuli]